MKTAEQIDPSRQDALPDLRCCINHLKESIRACIEPVNPLSEHDLLAALRMQRAAIDFYWDTRERMARP